MTAANPRLHGPGLLDRLAGRVRRAGRRVFGPDHRIAHIDVVVVGRSSAESNGEVSADTLGAVERARRALDGRMSDGPDTALGGSPGVSVNIVRGHRAVQDLSVDPGVMWLFVLDGAAIAGTALVDLVSVFDQRPDLDLAYGDAAGPDGEPWLLPGFSPDRLADQYYLGHVVALRPHRLVSDGDHPEPGTVARAEIDGPWSAAAVARTVAHLPVPLSAPAPGPASDRRGLERRKRRAPDVDDRPWPPVSVVIPTNGSSRLLERGRTRLVDQAVRSVLDSVYPTIEIVVVTTPGTADGLVPQLAEIVATHTADRGERRFTVVADDRPFNFSNACNRGAVASRGDVLVFLNDDTEVRDPAWLLHLVDHAVKPGVGAVGARLLHEDGRVQHSGIWSRGGHPTHRYEGWPGDATGYRGALRVTQNCLAVTGACLAVERTKFELVGGFSPVFPNSYNDVDLCLKLWDRGYRTVVEPRAELFHFEASTRDPAITDDDLAALHDRWRWRLNHDPFDNPNHTAERSEEWPLPAGSGSASPGSRHQPRFWPLDPVGRVSPG